MTEYCRCGRVATQNHHVFFGYGFREIADKFEEMQIALCEECHTKPKTGVHGGNVRLDLQLKKEAQEAFEVNHSHEMFMGLIGTDYIKMLERNVYELQDLFQEVKDKEFVDSDEGYIVETDICEAWVSVKNGYLTLSWIFSHSKGGGSDMLNRLELYSDGRGLVFQIANPINATLIKMAKNRNYTPVFVEWNPAQDYKDEVLVFRRLRG